MKPQTMMALCAAVGMLGLLAPAHVTAQAQSGQSASQAAADNRLRDFSISEQGGTLYLRLDFERPLDALPAHFSVNEPARIAYDFPNTGNTLGRVQQTVNRGDLRSVNIVESGGRTRLVLNLSRLPAYDAKIEGNELVIALAPAARPEAGGSPATATVQALANFSAAPGGEEVARSIQDVTFRRGEDGEGRVVVQLSSADTAVNVFRQGSNLVVDFAGTQLPEHLQRRSDVTDFGTPITTMISQPQGDNARVTVVPNGLWEHSAYQTESQFVLEVRRLVEDPNRLVQTGGREDYAGEKLSLNFQNVEIRSVLQVIADFTDFNIVTSDSVQGNLTLRLNDVPWDQALDIILQAKGLDKRRTGNVIWIAPTGELAARERQQLEAQAQRGDLEPLVTESFQINYHNAKEIFEFLKSKDQTVLSSRGSVVVDERSNKVFVTDVSSRLDALRRLIQEIDTAPRQVLIEARVVEANKDFARDLGVRMNFGNVPRENSSGETVSSGVGNLGSGARGGIGRFDPSTGLLTSDGGSSGGTSPVASFSILNLALFNSSATRFLNLELAALEQDGRGRVVSSPRVLTANQVEASIEQGTEIPYRKETSSGATSVEFKKAVLSLKVRPQITPDGRVQLRVQVNKDRPLFQADITEPAIDTKNVQTEVLVDNGGTVVIGGIYEEEDTTTVARVPLLGEIPVLGVLFRNTRRVSNRRELLVFITPRIVSDSLTLR
ncbi:MAG: type IV pilus secretin PilQ [Azoarcus sp.]|nr:type IV pilus secretin PilQ [Azoarcus sp.]